MNDAAIQTGTHLHALALTDRGTALCPGTVRSVTATANGRWIEVDLGAGRVQSYHTAAAGLGDYLLFESAHCTVCHTRADGRCNAYPGFPSHRWTTSARVTLPDLRAVRRHPFLARPGRAPRADQLDQW